MIKRNNSVALLKSEEYVEIKYLLFVQCVDNGHPKMVIVGAIFEKINNDRTFVNSNYNDGIYTKVKKSDNIIVFSGNDLMRKCVKIPISEDTSALYHLTNHHDKD